MKSKALALVQAFVGFTAVGGGVALAAAPDGRFLQADPTVLAGSPFSDFLVPGILLAVFVGGGGLLTAVMTWRHTGFSEPVAVVYAFGLLAFEVVKFLLIGFQALQVFEATLAAVMLSLLAIGRAPAQDAQSA